MWVWLHQTPPPLRGRPNPLPFARAHRFPAPPRGNVADDGPSLMFHALCMRVSVGWATGRPTVVGGGAGAAPDCVGCHLHDIDPPEGGDDLISRNRGQG